MRIHCRCPACRKVWHRFESSLVRPRAVAAGISFAIFFGVPAVLSFRTFKLFGLRRSFSAPIPWERGQEKWVDLLVVVSLFMPCSFLPLAVRFMMKNKFEPPFVVLQVNPF